jgi:hypothetical protein
MLEGGCLEMSGTDRREVVSPDFDGSPTVVLWTCFGDAMC